ncbi:hypothetical protein JCM5353_005184 [Sporobolomyces roseus]
MSTPAASRSAVRLLVGLPKPLTRSTAPALPFFSPSSTSFRSLPFFYPSRQSVPSLRSHNSYFTPSTPSPTFTSLRTAFHTSSRLSPLSKPSIASIQRSFSTSTVTRGIRPYYGRGGSGGGGRGPGGWKDKINSVDQKWILGGLLAINVAVYAAWAYGQELATRFRDASWIRFLQRNFTVSWQNISSGRVWCLLTSAFSHEGTGHLVFNMITLFFMAPPVLAMLGNVGFLSLYIFSGLSASTFSLLFNHFITQNPHYAAHGASGATYGCIAFFAAAMPRATFLLFFVVPVPAWLCVSGLFAWDFYNATSRRGGMTDSAGHVGGIASGLLFFLRKVGRI